MARLLRGYGVSNLRPPTVVGAGIAFHGPGVRLTDPFSPRDVARRNVHSRLSPPAVLTAVVPFSATPLSIHLSPSPRGARKAEYQLIPPFVVDAAVGPLGGTAVQLAPQPTRARSKSRLSTPSGGGAIAFHGPGVRLTDPLSPNFINRRKAFSRLSLPSVVTPAVVPFVARPSVVHLAPSARQGRKATYDLAGPFVINAPPRAKGRTATQFVQPSRIPTHSRLFPPAVTTAVVAATYSGPLVTLSPSRAGKAKPRLLPVPAAFQPFRPAIVSLSYAPTRAQAKSHLSAPTVVAPVLARRILVTLAPQKRGAPRSILRAPAVVGPVLARPIDTTFAQIRPVRTIWVLRKPTDLVDQQDLGTIKTHLAYSLRGRPKSHFSQPAVVSPVLARPIEVTLVRIRPVRTNWILRRPVDLVDRDDLGSVRVHLAYSVRGEPKSILRPPTVVAPVLARAILTTLVTIRPTRTIFILRRPTDLVDQADLGYVRVHLAYSLRGLPKSRLEPPTVVAPVLARPIEVSLARIRPARTIWEIKAPTVVHLAVEIYGPDTSLAPSFRGTPKSFLLPPTDLVDRQDLGYLRTHIAYSLRGAPHSRLAPPTVVAPVLARPILVELARITPAPVHSILRRPIDIVDQQDVGSVKVHLAQIRPVAVHPRLSPPAVVGPVLARAIGITLAPQKSGAPKSFLRPAIIPPLAPQIEEEVAVRITLASLPTRETRSRLFPPVVVGPVLASPIEVVLTKIRPPKTIIALRPPTIIFSATPADAVADITLVRITPPPVHYRLQPPTVVLPFFARALDLTLVPSHRGVTRYFLRPMGSPAVAYAPIAIFLAPSTRIPRAPHSRLQPPAVIDNRPQTYFLTVSLAYSRRGAPRSFLQPPPDIQDTPRAETVLAVTLAYSRRGAPKSKLNPPAVVTAATAYLRAIDTTIVRIRPVRTLTFLRRPADTVGIEDQGTVAITLAASFRGRPKARLSAPTVVFPFVASPIRVDLARIRPVATHSVLRRPIDLVDQQDLGYLHAHLAYSFRGRPTSRLSEPAVVAPVLAKTINVSLAPQRRGSPRSRLAGLVYGARVYAPISVRLAPQARGDAKSFLREVTYEARVYAPLKVTFAPSPRLDRAPHSRLKEPSAVGKFTANPISVSLAPSHGGKTLSRLQPPTEVFRFVAEPIRVELTRTKQKSTIAFIRLPTLAEEGSLGPKVALTRIRPARTISRLLPPAVVTPYVAPVDTTLSVNLAYSLRGRPKSRLTFIAGRVVPGTVCGMVLDLSVVCETIMTDTNAILPGGVLDTSAVHGDVTGSEVIIGDDLSIYSVIQEIE